MFKISFTSGLLSQREFLVVRLSLREFLASLLPYKVCNLSQFLSLVTVYLLTTCNHYYYCKCDVLFSINKYFQFYVHYTIYCYHYFGRITVIPDGSKLLSFTLIILTIPLLGWLCRLLNWFYSIVFMCSLTYITFNLYYCCITEQDRLNHKEAKKGNGAGQVKS